MGWNGAVLAGGVRNSRTAEEVFDDIKGRRNGLISALTNDFESFYSQCDPAKENLCLYGYPDGNWEVKLPGGELPEELPEPILGINSARDSTPKNVWWRLVALHCDAWLLSMAFYFGARYGFDKSDRNRLFDMINGLPTIFEIVHEAVIEADKEQVKHKSSGETKKRKHSEIIGWDGATLAGGACNSLTVEEVFNDFKGRRAALITALTDDFELFYMQCDPEKENLCLYGYPDGKWEVKSPSEEAPQYLPEPILGINFARVGMEKKDWQCLVAAYSDAWLLSVVFHLGAINGFDKSDRNRLFDMINDLPVILEIAREADKDQVKDDSSGNLGVDK